VTNITDSWLKTGSPKKVRTICKGYAGIMNVCIQQDKIIIIRKKFFFFFKKNQPNKQTTKTKTDNCFILYIYLLVEWVSVLSSQDLQELSSQQLWCGAPNWQNISSGFAEGGTSLFTEKPVKCSFLPSFPAWKWGAGAGWVAAEVCCPVMSSHTETCSPLPLLCIFLPWYLLPA